jgi:uncharacterized membrane protein
MPSSSSFQVNLGFVERWLSVALGAVMVGMGLARGRLPGLLAALGGGYLFYRGSTGRCAVYKMLGLEPASAIGLEVRGQVSVARNLRDSYAFWKDFTNLPRFMRHLARVEVSTPGWSHWVVRLPAGIELDWHAVIVEDQPEKRIVWRSIPESMMVTTGEVRFAPAPGDQGTEVHVTIHYQPPAGLFGETAARLVRSATARQLQEDLGQFKRLIETGENSSAETDRVIEASEESFPASDAPAWTVGIEK